MTRRTLIALPAGLPIVGRFVPKLVLQHVLTPERVFPPIEHVYTFDGYRRVEYLSREELEKEFPS
jgi:hypothetical protein